MKTLIINEISEEEYLSRFNFNVGDLVTVRDNGEIDGNNCSLAIGDEGRVLEVTDRHLLIEFKSGIKKGNTQRYLRARFIKKRETTYY